jgi:hypothetical protein
VSPPCPPCPPWFKANAGFGAIQSQRKRASKGNPPIPNTSPLAQLPTNLRKGPDLTKPKPLMQPNARGIRQCNTSQNRVEATRLDSREELRINSLPNPPPMEFRTHINTDFTSLPIPAARLPGYSASEALNLISFDRNCPWIPLGLSEIRFNFRKGLRLNAEMRISLRNLPIQYLKNL